MVKLLVGVGALAFLTSCRNPTQVRVLVSTDVGCGRGPNNGVAVGSLTDFDTRPLSATSGPCVPSTNDGGADFGALVIVSSGENEEVAVKVVQGQDTKSAESCLNADDAYFGRYCIVARRILRYVPNRTIDIEVPMLDECRGVRCDPSKTCVRKGCVSAVLDMNDCLARGTCTQRDLGNADAGPASDAGDATIVSTTDAGDAMPADATDATVIQDGDAGDAMPDATDATVIQDGDAGDGRIFAQQFASNEATLCSVTDAGIVCWGGNRLAELGRGFASNDAGDPGFVSPNVNGAIRIAGNTSTFCALQASPNPTLCWGTSRAIDSRTDAGDAMQRPVSIELLRGAVDIAVARNHICFQAQDGGVSCFGADTDGFSDGYSFGQLGRSTDAGVIVPVLLPDASVVTQLVGARDGTAVLLGSGDIYGWGQSRTHEFGAPLPDGGDNVFSPTLIAWGLTLKPRFLAAYATHLCAVVDGKYVACWGNNDHGKAGGDMINNTTAQSPSLVLMKDGGALDAVSYVAVGLDSSCAVAKGSKVYCWGSNQYGQLGVPRDSGTLVSDDSGTYSRYALEVTALTAVTDAGVQVLTLGDRHACARTEAGTTWCWGENDAGQLGKPSSVVAATYEPQQVVLP